VSEPTEDPSRNVAQWLVEVARGTRKTPPSQCAEDHAAEAQSAHKKDSDAPTQVSTLKPRQSLSPTLRSGLLLGVLLVSALQYLYLDTLLQISAIRSIIFFIGLGEQLPPIFP
jgi:hypothetical protein